MDSARTKIWTMRRLANTAAILCLACGAGALHYWHASSMFESDRNFTHISPLQREMSLRTEMGFYYYFYKTIVEEKYLLNSVSDLVYNRLVEYPNEVNAVNRFNIYPEILMGGLHHHCAEWLRRWRSPLADPIFFYLEAVWWCAGGTLAALFLSAVALCGNTVGGLAAVAQYLANHAECTRVQWAPNERENFAQPFLIAQAALVTFQVRRPSLAANHIALQIVILLVNCICLMCWQFSQFIFLTQVAIFFMMEQLRVISPRQLGFFLHAHLCGLHLAVMLMQWNHLLLTSLYTSFFLVVSTYALLLSPLRIKVIETRLDLAIEAWLVLIRIGIVVSGSLWLKNVISEAFDVEDDSHIFEIFYSKFTNYKTFHTMLYTCSAVFNFLPMSYFWKVTRTGLLPLIGLGISNVVYYWIVVSRKDEKTEFESAAKVDSAADNPKKKKEKVKAKAEEGSGEDSGIEHSVSETKARKKNARRRRKSSSKSQKDESDDNKPKHLASVTKTNDCDIKCENIDDSKSSNDNPKEVDSPKPPEAIANEIPQQNTEKAKVHIVADDKPTTDPKNIESKATAEKPPKKKRNCHKWVLFLRRMDIDPGTFYNITQMVVFGFMAIIIMRLKLLFTPQMCIVASLAFNPLYYNKRMKQHKGLLLCVAAALGSVAAYNGYSNFIQERSYIGEYSDPPLEELLTWISTRTGAGAVFAGPVPLTAAVLLGTRRAIVDHVHYERKEARQRVYAVYKTYGRFSPAELYSEMARLRVTYLLVEAQYCYGRSGMGCTFEEIWDHEVPSLRGRPLLCRRLLTEDLPHFYKVFENEQYAAFYVHDYSVRYTPRLYDT